MRPSLISVLISFPDQVLLDFSKSFTLALKVLGGENSKMSKDFNLSDKTMQYVHNHAMHFVKQYLRIYSSRQKPLFQSCQNLVGQPVHQLLVKNAYFKTSNMSQPNNHERLLILLERTALQSAVLGLVFKTHFQDYALEHVASALERFELSTTDQVTLKNATKGT